MSWQYSDPLNGALLAAQQNNQSNDLAPTSLYQPLFNKFEPIYSHYQPRINFLDKTPASINIFDEIDDFDLEVETDNILSARYRIPNNVYKQPSYVPSYFNNSNNASLNIEQEEKNLTNRSLNNDSQFRIRQDQLSLNKQNNNQSSYQNAFQPMPPFDLRSTPPSSIKSDNSYQASINSSGLQNHNSQHQRFVQYQQRIMQDKGESLSELELMKMKQKQDRLQLLQSIQQEKDQYQKYQPIYQEHHIIKKQYSETSIPSTNADPLSNSPTPPMLNHKYYAKINTDRSEQKNINYVDNGNLQANNKKYYYKLNDGSTEKLNVPKKPFQTVKGKYTASDYKQYQKNFGFGTNFLPFEAETKQEKIEKAKKRDEYSRKIKEQNLRGSNVLQNSRFNNNNNNNNFVFTNDPVINKRINEFDINKRNKGKELVKAK